MNENYFNNIDHPHKAYIIGFIAADGCIIIDPKWYKNRVEITIKESDVEVLEFIYKELDLSCKISYRTVKTSYSKCKSARLNIDSKIIINDLLKLGLAPRKSLTLKTPNIPKKYLIDFYRGLFDGDGGITFGENGSIQVHLCGTLEVVTDFKIFCESYLSKKYPIRKNHSIWSYIICGRNAIKILDILYQRGFGLSRKKISYITYKNNRNFTKFIGIHKRKNRYQAYIKVNKKYINLGRYDTDTEAAMAYNNYVVEHKLNRTLNEIKNE